MQEELSFEEIMKKLEEKTKEVETGEFNLDKAVKAYEEGINLVKLANQKLDEAEKKIVALNIKSDDTISEEEI